MSLKRILCIWVLLNFSAVSIIPAQAQLASNTSALPFILPKPGSRVSLSPVFEPALIKGLKVHPDNPFNFDFIVDPGNEKLDAGNFKQVSQRLINYFLAALATPEKDLWVNLSPVEKDHIIPDALNKTELGRDLLAEDYMLKQIGASLIYPESHLGKMFWGKVYNDAYKKFGKTEIPVNVFNKIWILPQKASVYEKGNSVYIVKAHLKVMLEEDLLAQRLIGQQRSEQTSNAPVKDLSKQVLREVILPAIEKEVNEDKNFAQLRQIFYSLILAQWYRDVFKTSILNKDYSGRNKVAGIDVNDPQNKELIYQRYLSAYRKGVFNYIKEETQGLSQDPMPRKYFSGGFVGQKIERTSVSGDDFSVASGAVKEIFQINVHLDPAMSAQALESRESWNDLNRPLGIFDELKGLITKRKFNRLGLYAFIDKYSPQLDTQELYPVQGAWPVLKAITLLNKNEEEDLIAALEEKYSNAQRPELVDKIFLMNNIIDRGKWMEERAPNLIGRRIYLVAAEIHHWAGGLGPVMKFHGKGMHDLGADVAYIEPWYQLRRDKGNPAGDPLDYTDPDVGLKELDENFDQFDVQVGDRNGVDMRTVHVKIATGIDQNGLRVYMFSDILPDGSSFYTKMLYNYWEPGGVPLEKSFNPITKEESMAFLNVASATLIERLETKRKQEQGHLWKPAVVHTNDGQYAPLEAVTMSKYAADEVIKNIFWAFTTHTYWNRGQNRDNHWAVNVFFKHMMGIKLRFINAFQQNGYIDYTSGGVRLANWAGAVSDKHRDDVSLSDNENTLVSVTNGAVPEEMATIYREEFAKLEQEDPRFKNADYERPTAEQDGLVKEAAKQRLNEAKIRTANGGADVLVDLNSPMIGYVRRLVPEKVGRQAAFTDVNIRAMVMLGYNVILTGNNQGSVSAPIMRDLKELENQIAHEKETFPQEFPGKFQFVDSMTPLQKKLFLAAADIQVQDSYNHTGAAEFSEEDITANGGLQGGPPYREGVIVDQGIPLDFEHSGKGQTLIPKEDTAKSWLETVYVPLMSLWNKDPRHLDFYTNAALSPRLNRIQRYLITSAAYLRQYNKQMQRQEDDLQSQSKIVSALGDDRETISQILYNGHNEVKRFGFNVPGQRIEADTGGLVAFLAKKKELEDEYGYDVFRDHISRGDFQKYLIGLFSNTPSTDLLKEWMDNLDRSTDEKVLNKNERLTQFAKGIAAKLEVRLQEIKTDQAMIDPGGIKFGHFDLERQGQLTKDIVSDQSLENILINARGLQGVIVGITLIADLTAFMR